MATNDALLAGLREAADLIDAAQAILADHVRPDGLSAEEALFELLELLDNTISRRAPAAMARRDFPRINLGADREAASMCRP